MPFRVKATDGKVQSERTNLEAIHPEKAAELHPLLQHWRAEMNAPVPTELNPKSDSTATTGKKKKGREKKG